MEDSTQQKKTLIEDIINLYEQYFGSNMAESYRRFYSDKDINTILLSSKELIEELMGPVKGNEMFEKISQQYHLDLQL